MADFRTRPTYLRIPRAWQRWCANAVCLTLVMAILLGTGAVRAQEAQGIAAIVNDEIISVHDVLRRIDLLVVTSNMSPSPENRERIGAYTLRLLIEEKLKTQEARRLNIAVTRDDLQSALDQISGQIGVPSDQLPAVLSREGADIQDLIEQIEAEIAWVKTVRARNAEELDIGEEAVEARLQVLAANAGKPQYRVAEIFLPVIDPRREAEVADLVQRLAQEMQQGATFQALARNFSQGPTASEGGDLGWQPLNAFDPELQSTIAELQPGQAFGPVRTVLGYYILFMIDRRTVPPPDASAVVVDLYRFGIPFPQNQGEAGLRRTALQVQEVADAAQTCSDLSAAAAQNPSPFSGDMGSVELERLDERIRELIRPLDAGGKTQPIVGQRAVAIFMVCDRREQDMSEQIREQVRLAIFRERLASASRRLLRDLRRDAFIDIRNET